MTSGASILSPALGYEWDRTALLVSRRRENHPRMPGATKQSALASNVAPVTGTEPNLRGCPLRPSALAMRHSTPVMLRANT